jgi:hypothetical protein
LAPLSGGPAGTAPGRAAAPAGGAAAPAGLAARAGGKAPAATVALVPLALKGSAEPVGTTWPPAAWLPRGPPAGPAAAAARLRARFLLPDFATAMPPLGAWMRP